MSRLSPATLEQQLRENGVTTADSRQQLARELARQVGFYSGSGGTLTQICVEKALYTLEEQGRIKCRSQHGLLEVRYLPTDER
jgi:hypothetical protein